jgi:hypothetical protein
MPATGRQEQFDRRKEIEGRLEKLRDIRNSFSAVLPKQSS